MHARSWNTQLDIENPRNLGLIVSPFFSAPEAYRSLPRTGSIHSSSLRSFFRATLAVALSLLLSCFFLLLPLLLPLFLFLKEEEEEKTSGLVCATPHTFFAQVLSQSLLRPLFRAPFWGARRAAGSSGTTEQNSGPFPAGFTAITALRKKIHGECSAFFRPPFPFSTDRPPPAMDELPSC